jgi:acyl carrier protein
VFHQSDSGMTVEPTATLDPSRLERELLRLVRDHLLDGIDEDFDVLASLPDAGLDSMAIMQLLLLIEDRFGVWLPEEDLTRENFACIRSLALAVIRRHATGDADLGGERGGRSGEKSGGEN